MRRVRQFSTRIGTAVVLHAASAWAWLRAQVMGDDDANFAPDPILWRCLLLLAIGLAALVIGAGVTQWGAK